MSSISSHSPRMPSILAHVNRGLAETWTKAVSVGRRWQADPPWEGYAAASVGHPPFLCCSVEEPEAPRRRVKDAENWVERIGRRTLIRVDWPLASGNWAAALLGWQGAQGGFER